MASSEESTLLRRPATGRPRLYLNLIVVMALGGLWHGAANTFLVWGALHGVALAVERALGLHDVSERGGPVARALWWAVVQGTVLVGWVFFRSPSVEYATTVLANVATGSWVELPASVSLGGLALLLLVPVLEHVRAILPASSPSPSPLLTRRAAWAAVMLYLACTAFGPAKTFIYFQF